MKLRRTMPRKVGHSLLGHSLLGLGLVLLAGQAAATDIVIADFSGRKADVIRSKVEGALKRGGHTVSLGNVGAELSDGAARRLARLQGASAVVVGNVARLGQREWQAVLQVLDGRTGKQLGDDVVFNESWLPGLTRSLIDTAAKRLKPFLTQSEQAVPPGSELAGPLPEASAVGENAPPSGRDSEQTSADEAEVWDADLDESGDMVADSGSGGEASSVPEDGALFRLVARGGMVRRSLSFSDDFYDRLRTYDVNMGVYQVEGIVYPFTRPVGERLGIIASYESGVSGAVIDANNSQQFNANFQEFFFGLRARYPVDEHEVGFDLTYGQMKSGLDDPGGGANVPDTNYSIVRTALHGALNFGNLTAIVSTGFRLPLGYGELSEDGWFPRVSGYGVEASAGLSYPIATGLVVEATASLRRFILEMNSEPEDAQGVGAEVAGGAIDRYLGGYVGVSYRL